MNAIAHAVEGLYAPDATPIILLMVEEGVRALAAALPEVVTDGSNRNARAEAQYGAWLCGAVLAATTMSLHHKLCHTLGGTLDLPHAQMHTVVLPHALAYNQPAAPDAVAALSRALGGAEDPARALWELAGRLSAPRSLSETRHAGSGHPARRRAGCRQSLRQPAPGHPRRHRVPAARRMGGRPADHVRPPGGVGFMTGTAPRQSSTARAVWSDPPRAWASPGRTSQLPSEAPRGCCKPDPYNGGRRRPDPPRPRIGRPRDRRPNRRCGHAFPSERVTG